VLLSEGEQEKSSEPTHEDVSVEISGSGLPICVFSANLMTVNLTQRMKEKELIGSGREMEDCTHRFV
jgi:hypothetical protein